MARVGLWLAREREILERRVENGCRATWSPFLKNSKIAFESFSKSGQKILMYIIMISTIMQKINPKLAILYAQQK
jgi:hypothetical protein